MRTLLILTPPPTTSPTTCCSAITAIGCVYGFAAGGFPSLPPTILADYYGNAFPLLRTKLLAVCVQTQLAGT